MPRTETLTTILMAKAPCPGAVKTRLISSTISQQMAAEIAEAMLGCVARRLAAVWPNLVLAVSPDNSADLITQIINTSCRTIDQGAGDLGERICRVWRAVGADVPAVLVGIDSPDVPTDILATIPHSLAQADVAIGQTPDGGYWSLAANRLYPNLFENIDWGGADVYDQTYQAARDVGVKIHTLPAWPDVDTPEDLLQLKQRLEKRTTSDHPTETPLDQLEAKLDNILSNTP